MQEKPTFDEILERWLADNGGKIKGDINARVYLFFQLYAALEEYGYGKAEVQFQARNIKAVCFNENSKVPAAQKAKWKDVIDKSFKQSLVMYPPWQFKMATFDAEKTPLAPTQYPEMPESLKVQESPATSDDYSESSDESYEEIASTVKREEFDPEEWAKKPTPEPLYDPELRLLFGFKK